ncbi:MAG: hypothetical protein O2U61_04250 [Candidatus Bathyarchaeota archaeon]|nr:hypothetical protein [Candidatus Bathyarchaeota archaeon]
MYLRRTLYAEYKGWEMVKNKYVAIGTGEVIDRGVYVIDLLKGTEKQRIKIPILTTKNNFVVHNETSK